MGKDVGDNHFVSVGNMIENEVPDKWTYDWQLPHVVEYLDVMVFVEGIVNDVPVGHRFLESVLVPIYTRV